MNNDTIDIKYRFPIFKQEKWKLHKLSEIAEYTNGRAHEQDIDVNGKYVVVNSKYISTDGTVIKYSNTANCLAEKNDILMVLSDVPNGRAIAKCYLVKENNKYTVNQRICRITPKQGIESSLLYYLMNRNPYFLSFDDGVKQTNLRNDDVLNFEILLPSNQAEQQKIAACLISLDNVITGHEEKLTALEEYKKGLMQNLFPQEGETKPKYRFPEFENDGDWVEKKLGKVAEFFKGKGISKNDIIENGQISCIRYGELYTTYAETILNVISKTNIDKSELLFSLKNDVIIPSSGETQIDIATASCVMLDNIALGGDLNVIRTKINGVFLSYYLNSTKKLEIAKMAQGNAVVHLYNHQLATLSITFPKPKEQQKIAEVLSSVDELIVAQREKIEALKEHKKGLMQGLFPKIES